MKPARVVIEIAAGGYSHKLFDESGEEIWGDQHTMESAGCSISESKEGIFDHAVAEQFYDLAGAIDDLCCGPFGVAQALWHIAHDEVEA